MNERIRKMILEVGFAGYGEDTGSYNISVTAFDSRIERFAELIVDECTNVFKQNWTMGGSSHPISAVKKHFGVEE